MLLLLLLYIDTQFVFFPPQLSFSFNLSSFVGELAFWQLKSKFVCRFFNAVNLINFKVNDSVHVRYNLSNDHKYLFNLISRHLIRQKLNWNLFDLKILPEIFNFEHKLAMGYTLY